MSSRDDEVELPSEEYETARERCWVADVDCCCTWACMGSMYADGAVLMGLFVEAVMVGGGAVAIYSREAPRFMAGLRPLKRSGLRRRESAMVTSGGRVLGVVVGTVDRGRRVVRVGGGDVVLFRSGRVLSGSELPPVVLHCSPVLFSWAMSHEQHQDPPSVVRRGERPAVSLRWLGDEKLLEALQPIRTQRHGPSLGGGLACG